MKKTSSVISLLEMAVFVIVIAGTALFIYCGITVFSTAIRLNAISNNISYINEIADKSAPGYEWTDKRTSEYENLKNERIKIYNSDNFIVKWFSNSEKRIQLITIFVLIVLWISIFVVWVVTPLKIISINIRRKRKIISGK